MRKKSGEKKTAMTMSDVLRQTILESETPLLVLEREAGVQRASIRRFLRGERSLHLDIADKLAAYYRLKLMKQGD